MSDTKIGNDEKNTNIDHEVHDLSSLNTDDNNEPEFIQTSIPFKKSLELFFTTKAPPKKEKKHFFFWYPPNQSKAEKKLVFKLDLTIMTYICLSYFVRYLDANNVSSAYVTGMKEEIGISGAQYVWLTQLFGAAYCFTGFFSNILLTRVRFSRFLPVVEFTWGLLCLFIYKAESFKTIAILRFFQGALEGIAWPAFHTLLGSWYTGQELAKRTSIFTASGILGLFLSGLIQSGLQKSMHGKHGLSGWRWLFIIDAIVTFPIAFLGFLVPDTPELSTKSKLFFTDDELNLARERIKINGKKRLNNLDRTVIKRVVTSYQFYLFIVAWILWGFGGTLVGYFSIVLKALGYNVYDRNNIPTGVYGVGIVTCLLSGFIIDLTGRRIEVALTLQIFWIVGAAVVKSYGHVTNAGLIFGYVIMGSFYATSPLIVGWCNELAREDNQLRAATIGSLNLFSGLLGIPFSTGLFNTDLAPKYERAATATVVLAVLLFFYFFVILAFDRYQQRKRQYIKELEDEKASGIDAVVEQEFRDQLK